MQIPKKKESSRKKALYKTELCLSAEEFGQCPYGTKCQFAHSPSELRNLDRHPRYKTQRCNTFWENGSCPYGRRCCFIHMENPSISGVNLSQIDDDNFVRQRSQTVPSQPAQKQESPKLTKSLQASPIRENSTETMVSDLDGAFEKISLSAKSTANNSPDLKIKTKRVKGLSQLEIHNVFTDFGPFTAPLSPVAHFGRSATEPMSANIFGSSFGRSFGNDQHSPMVSSFGRNRRGFPDVWKPPMDQELNSAPFAVDSQAFGSLGSAFANINSPIFGDGDSIRNMEIESVRSRPSSPKMSTSLRNWGEEDLMDNLQFGRSLH